MHSYLICCCHNACFTKFQVVHFHIYASHPQMTSYNSNRSFFDRLHSNVPERKPDSRTWQNVKELPAGDLVPCFDTSKNVGIGRCKTRSTVNVPFVGPVENRKLTFIPYIGNRQTLDDFEVLLLNPEEFEWKKTDETKELLPTDAFITGVITDYGQAYIGKHEVYGIGMILGLETSERNFWTYFSTSGEKFLTFEVLCSK